MAKQDPVLIVGAGLAGLSCALELQAAGIPFLILEAADEACGRVRTDLVEGFRLDRGFQVYLSAYPDASRLLDYDDLQLRPFYPGALIRSEGRFRRLTDPWRKPLTAASDLWPPVLHLGDLLRMGRLRRAVLRLRELRALEISQVTTADYLRDFGFSDRTINLFFRPFFGGVFLDPELKTAGSTFAFVFRMMSLGPVCLPSSGMGSIPGQLSRMLAPGSLMFGERVTGVHSGGVEVESGREWSASAVVVATDGKEAHRMIGSLPERPFQTVTCLYFYAPQPPFREPYLVLNSEGSGPINNLVIPTNVSSDYHLGQEGCLVSITVLGCGDSPERLLDAVTDQLTDWFGGAVRSWKHLRTYEIKRALPRQFPQDLKVRMPVLPSGMFVCGDFLENASINGAVVSGRAAAGQVIRFLRPTRG
jgi:phytoene dehydrogenase-like protein